MENDFEKLKLEFLNNPKPSLYGQSRFIREDYDCAVHTIRYNVKEYFLINYYSIVQKHIDIKEIIKQEMLRQNYTLTSRDIGTFRKDVDIVRLSIKNNPLSINEAFLEEFPQDILDYLINNLSSLVDISNINLLKNEYFISQMLLKNPSEIFLLKPEYIKDIHINIVINSNQKLIINNPIQSILKTNYKLLLKALESNSLYIKYFDLDILNEKELDVVTEILLKDGYTISMSTPKRLTTNPKLVRYTLIRNPRLISYIPFENNEELIKIIIETKAFSRLGYDTLKLFQINNPLILNDFINNSALDKDAISNIKMVFQYGLNISTLKEMLRSYYTEEWEVYKKKYPNLYNHIFQSFKDTLKHTQEIEDLYDILPFYRYMNDVLEKGLLERTIRLYKEKLYNNEDVNDVLDIISNLCALFISKSKDNYINNKIDYTLKHIKNNYYEIDLSNPNIKNRIYRHKRLLKLQELLKTDQNIINEINNIKSKYNINNIDELFNKVINNIPLEIPNNYDKYLIKEKVSKIINRLNSGNIDESNIDYIKYKDYIIKNNNKYELINIEINNIEEIELYKEQSFIYKKLSVDISKLLNQIKIDEDIDLIKRSLSMELEFNDNNFNINYRLNIRVKELVDRINKINIIMKNYDEEDKALINKLLYKDGLFIYSILNIEDIDDDKKHLINYEDIIEVIKNYHKIINVIGKNKFKVNNIENIIKINEIIKNSNTIDLYILNEETIYKILTSNSLIITDSHNRQDSLSSRITYSSDLLSQMQTINKFTVPRVKGECSLYTYEVYDQSDIDVLTSGIDTNSCFKVCGVDHDFLHYCCLNKNGFMIKIKDKEGNFIGRISGIRNGNGIYLNELRSIYDYDSNTKNLSVNNVIRDGLLEVLKVSSKHIIDTLRNNGEKVDFALIVQFFVLSTVDRDYYGHGVDIEVERLLNHTGPMPTNTPDWKEFIENPNLKEKGERFNGIYEPGFTTDYQSGKPLMVVDTRVGDITIDKIDMYDPEPLYTRERYIKEDIINPTNINKFNRIKAINCNLSYSKFEPINLLGYNIIYGVDWYIIYDDKILETSINNKNQSSILEFQISYNKLLEKHNIKRL